jgi:hypothetical protein
VLTDETGATSRFSTSGFHVAQGRVWSERLAFVWAKAGLAAEAVFSADFGLKRKGKVYQSVNIGNS